MKKYNHLLLAIDIDENDEALIKQALQLAETYSADLSIVHVIPRVISAAPFTVEFQDSIRQHAQIKIAEIQKRFDLSDTQLFLREGKAQDEVVALASEIAVDLVLCGSHGKHGLQLILGSTANGILHHSKVDVLTLRVDNQGKRLAAFPYTNIVVAVDFTEDNQMVRNAAVATARIFGAKLHFIHVVASLNMLGYYPAVEFDFVGEAKKSLAALVLQEALPVESQNIHVEMGLPRQNILELAAQTDAELIVVGSHSHKVFTSFILGSTANAVLHGAKSDVMVVRI